MARITRKNQKIFAGNASNNGVFGSLQSDDPVTSNDPDTIQGRSAFENGWNDATYSAELLPPLEEFQGLQYLFSRQIAYLFQEGIAEWNTSTTYYKGSIVKSISGTRIYIYLSIADNNTGNLVSDTTKWKLLYDSEFGYADINLSNLTSVGKNVGNWSTNVTNCITEIPQDIKLELSSGTLTLKSGSKVYVPNGSGVFGVVTTSSDIILTSLQNRTGLLYYSGGAIYTEEVGRSYSGSSYTGGTYGLWYDTTNNKIGWTSNGGSTFSYGASLPLAVVKVTTSGVTSIDQVFNGFGYIGSTVFALPGVKGIYPDGRNSDGTLKNTAFTISSVLTTTDTSGATGGLEYWLSSSSINRVNFNTYTYNSDTNLVINSSGVKQNILLLDSNSYRTGGKVTSFNPKVAFHATDYYDLAQVDSSAVHKTGNETIGGTKTFTDSVNLNSSGSSVGFVQKDTGLASNSTTPTVSRERYYREIANDGSIVGQVQIKEDTTGDYSTSLLTRSNVSGTQKNATLGIGVRANGDIYSWSPVPSGTNSTSDSNIATTGWVNDPSKSTNVVHRSGDESIAGFKKLTQGGATLVIQRGTEAYTEVQTQKSDSTRTGGFRNIADNGNTTLMYVTDTAGSNIKATVNVVWDGTNGYATAPSPPSATDNSSKIATTSWVRNHRCTTAATTTSTASVDAPAYVVENYKSGESWYRVWSDGWIEQGGYVSGTSTESNNKTVNFSKAFSDTNYVAQLTEYHTEWSSTKVTTGVQSKNTTNMTIRENSGQGCFWTAYGY